MHWESSDSWPAAEDVWSTVAWCRVALAAAQMINCRQSASALTIDTDMTMTYIWVWPDLFVIYFTGCVWCKQHRWPTIYFRWERHDVSSLLWSQPKMRGLSVSADCEVRGMGTPCTAPCSVCVSSAGAIKKCRKPEETLCLQGCQVLLFFYNIVLSVLFLRVME